MAKGKRTYKRSWKNFMLHPRYQLRHVTYIFSMSIAAIGIVLVLALWRTMELIKREAIPNADWMVQESLNQLADSIPRVVGLSFIAMAIISFMIGIVISHRVYGPMRAICQMISQLREGNYEINRELRKGDVLAPIAEEVKALADELKRQKAGK